MESLPENVSLNLLPDTLEAVRKCWGLDKPGQMKEAVAILDEWAKKQPHFLRTDFDVQFLENAIITSKGSIERAKIRLDKYCTLKSLMPKYFKKYDYNKTMQDLRPLFNMGLLPRLTSDYYRIIFSRLNGFFEQEDCIKQYMHNIIGFEYLKSHDYFNGAILILDFRPVELVSFIKKLNLMDLRDMVTIILEGYTVRVGGVHLITESKVIDILVNFLKQVMKPSLGNRIKVHKNLESLYECIDKDLLPAEYGGKERSIVELHDIMVRALGSAEHMEYMDRMRQYGTDETKRPKDDFNDNYIGMPGTFRMLSVD